MGAFPADSPAPPHIVFLAILPRIERHGRVYFRHVKNSSLKEEFIAEMVALAWKWTSRLAQQGKDVMRFPSAIATFAAKAVRSGRRLCGQEKGKDVLSPFAQQRHEFAVQSLPDFSTLTGNPLEDALIDNTVTPVDEQVAFRLDFPQWLSTYSDRDRRIALEMMVGERTLDVSEKYALSPGRIVRCGCSSTMAGVASRRSRRTPTPEQQKGVAVGKHTLMEEFHLSVYAIRSLPESECDAIRQALDSSQFRQRLKRAVRRVVRRLAPLHKVRVAVSH